MILFQLFLSFLQIGLFSFGGGYAALPLIQSQVIELHHWINMTEFTDLITISQMTPGPIAVNSATFIGLKMAGIPGAIVATLGVVLPSCLIVTVLAYVYLRFRKMSLLQGVLESLRPAVVAMIGTAGLSILVTAFFGQEGIIAMQNLKIDMVIIFIVALFLLMKMKQNPILVMVLCGVAKVIIYGISSYKRSAHNG